MEYKPTCYKRKQTSIIIFDLNIMGKISAKLDTRIGLGR